MPSTSGLGRRGGMHRRRKRVHRRRPSHRLAPPGAVVALAPVLAIQAALSVRLLHANAASKGEALCLRVGHLEIAHLLHGSAIPAFATYLSGSPVLFPPLGAMADRLGGLAGARALSLACMLGATALLFATAGKLVGRRAAWFAAALFAFSVPTIHLGASATFDGLSLVLLAGAAFLAVRAGAKGRRSGWLAAAALVLALANATMYTSALFDPVVVALAGVSAARVEPWQRALKVSGTLLASFVCILCLLLSLGGGEYARGISATTFAPAGGTSRVDVGVWFVAVAAGFAIDGLVRRARARLRARTASP